jgi:hypothetical protein
MKQSQSPKLNFLYPLAALLLILAVGYILYIIPQAKPQIIVTAENGVWDFRGFDFEMYDANFRGDVLHTPNALLTPEEFAERSEEAILGVTWRENPCDKPHGSVNAGRWLVHLFP